MVCLDHGLGDRHAETRTALLSCSGRIRRVEPFEDLRACICGNAGTMIAESHNCVIHADLHGLPHLDGLDKVMQRLLVGWHARQ